jgi:hypothetical protein
MEWQTADWFFVVILLVFVAMHFVGHGKRSNAGEKEARQHGPKINM